MNILHIGKYYPPFCGGIEKVNYDLVENLNKIPDCHADELCFCHEVGANMPLEYHATAYQLFRIPIRTILCSTPIPRGYFQAYKKIRNNYDVIHLHLPNPIAAMAPILIPTRAKLILHWHSDIVKQKALMSFYKPFQTAILRRCDKIIVTSQHYLDSSFDLQPYLDKVQVIPIGIDNAHLAFCQDDIDSIKNKYGNKKIVLSIGRLTYYKGFRYLIDAARNISDDAIILIGGCGELEKDLETQIKELKLEHKVKLIGRIPQNLMGAYYKAADVFCLPSIVRTEAFGVVLVEALSMGLPIIACNIKGSGVNWVNQNEETGFNVSVCDSVALAETINRLLQDPILLKKFSLNSRSRYNEIFTREKMVNSTYDLYQKILAVPK